MRVRNVVVVLLVLLPLLGALYVAFGGRGTSRGSAAAAARAGAPAPGDALVDAPDRDADAGSGTPSTGGTAPRAAVEPRTLPAPAIVGRVVGPGGEPLAGSVVEGRPAFEPDPASPPFGFVEELAALEKLRVTVRCAADGAFRLSVGGDAAHVDLTVRARGHAIGSARVRRPVEADVDAGTIALGRGAILAGVVLGPSGRPVPGAFVLASPEDGPSRLGSADPLEHVSSLLYPEWFRLGDGVVTGDDGRFELAHVAPGRLRLAARHAEYPLGELAGLDVLAGEHRTGLVLTLDPGTTIDGRVVGVGGGIERLVVAANRAETGIPPEARQFAARGGPAAVGLGLRFAAVARDGSFRLEGLRAGTYVVQAVEADERYQAVEVCSPAIECAGGAAGVELRYEVGAMVRLRVVDAASGAPIERVRVIHALHELRGPERLAFGPVPLDRWLDAPRGVVTIAPLRPRPEHRLSLEVRAVGHVAWKQVGIEVPAAGRIDLGTVRLAACPTVRVLAVDRASGEPVAGARVLVQAVTGGGVDPMRRDVPSRFSGAGPDIERTDAGGRCELELTAGQTVRVYVQSPRHALGESEPLDVPRHGALEVRAELVRGGALDVRVLRRGGAAVVGAFVEDLGPTGFLTTNATEADGRASFEHVLPGVHRCRIAPETGEGPELPWTDVEVVEGGRHELVLERPPGARLAGVVREDGAPLAGAVVQVEQRRSPAERDGTGSWRGLGLAFTDARGRYAIEDLPPGEARLRVNHERRAMPVLRDVVLGVGANAGDVDLDVTVLRGTVRDVRGEPVAGAQVEVRPASAPSGPLQRGFLEDDWGTDVRAAADGSFELRGVVAGARLVVHASAPWHLPALGAPVEVGAGAALEHVDVILADAGRVAVQTALDGAEAAVAVSRDAGGTAPVRARFDHGAALLDGLRPGSWDVGLEGPSVAVPPRRVEVLARRTTAVRF